LSAEFRLFVPEENICTEELLTLWEVQSGWKQYILLKASRFGIKTHELCESKSGYLWSYVIYTAVGSEIMASVNVEHNRKP
jgi:hypothetical protein